MRVLPRLFWLLRAAWLVAIAAGAALILMASAVYFGEDLAPFIIEKLPLPLEDVWMVALRVHVVAAAVCLPGCVLLSSVTVVRHVPRLHRWLGRATATLVVGALVPSGVYLAPFAKGGLPSTLGFLLSASISAVAMVQGVRMARARRFVEHRRWVRHVLGQLSVAVTSRAMLFAFDAGGVDETLAYLVSLWLPVVGTFVGIELLPHRKRPFVLPWRNHEAPVHARRPRPRPARPAPARGG